MKRHLSVVLFLVILFTLGLSSGANATTMSWDPVDKYTDGTDIEALRLPVTYDAWWSTSTTFVTPHNLLSNGTATSVVFDITAQGMVRGTTIYFGARARIANPVEVSVDTPPFSWTVPSLILSSIAITSGPSTVNENSEATYAASATWSDNSVTTITPAWSVSPATYASISASGVLTTSAVPSDQAVTITASYTSGGVTKTATKAVTITNSNRPVAPVGVRIGP